jgi:hypothetical protein
MATWDLNKTSRSEKAKLLNKKKHIPSYDAKESQVTKRSPVIRHRSRTEVYELIFCP